MTVHHTDKITVLVSCSKLPIEVSTDSMMSLAAVLGEIRRILVRFGVPVPPVPS